MYSFSILYIESTACPSAGVPAVNGELDVPRRDQTRRPPWPPTTCAPRSRSPARHLATYVVSRMCRHVCAHTRHISCCTYVWHMYTSFKAAVCRRRLREPLRSAKGPIGSLCRATRTCELRPGRAAAQAGVHVDCAGSYVHTCASLTQTLRPRT